MGKAKFCLLAILILATILRVLWLDKTPPGLFGDEVDVGYQAYSLLKTGKDYKGNFLPAYIDSFAEPRAPLLMYATAPFLAIFGLNEWGVRLVPAFFGILSILLLYALVWELFKDKVFALAAALFLAVTPWHLSYSRAAFEVSLLLFLILGGTFCFLKALRGQFFWLLAAVISFGLTFYTYNTANVFVPLWALVLVFFYRREIFRLWEKSSRKIVFSLGFGIMVVSPLLFQILLGSAAFRFNLISIFSNPRTLETIVFKRSAVEFGSILERFFHNKPIYWLREFLSNYLEAFSFKFLFVSGDPNPRHSIPGIGLLFFSFLPPLLLGLYQAIKKKDKNHWLIVGWLAIAPLASSLTVDGGNHATRLILMLPPLIILTSLGTALITRLRWGRFLILFLSITLSFEVLFYLHEMTVHYPKEQYRHWHYGYKEAVMLYKENKDYCQKLYLNNSHEPFLIRYLFWAQTDPSWFRENLISDKEEKIFEKVFLGFSLGNSYFGRIIVPERLEAVKALVAEKGVCYLAFQGDEVPGDWDFEKDPPSKIRTLGTVKDPWGKPYLYLLRGTNED